MATALKSLYNTSFFNHFLKDWKSINSKIDSEKFLQEVYVAEWDEMELKSRTSHICNVLQQQLPQNYENACKTLISLVKTVAKDGNERIEYYFLPEFVERFGLHDFNTSIKTIEEITQFYSCEFAIRPFLEKYPKESLAQMIKWSKHSHHKVRRLSSEGCRPNLPWAKKLQITPQKVLPILNALKADDSLIVRKSVANHLNDISKLQPHFFKQLLQEWKGKNTKTDWILKHASRTLLKSADKEVLAAFGYCSPNNIKLQNFQLTEHNIKIGDYLEFTFNLRNEGTKAIKIRLEFILHFLKANGKNAAKVFQIREKQLGKGEKITITKKHSFKPISTRKYYLGKQYISLIVNGKEFAKVAFQLV